MSKFVDPFEAVLEHNQTSLADRLANPDLYVGKYIGMKDNEETRAVARSEIRRLRDLARQINDYDAVLSDKGFVEVAKGLSALALTRAKEIENLMEYNRATYDNWIWW